MKNMRNDVNGGAGVGWRDSAAAEVSPEAPGDKTDNTGPSTSQDETISCRVRAAATEGGGARDPLAARTPVRTGGAPPKGLGPDIFL